MIKKGCFYHFAIIYKSGDIYKGERDKQTKNILKKDIQGKTSIWYWTLHTKRNKDRYREETYIERGHIWKRNINGKRRYMKRGHK